MSAGPVSTEVTLVTGASAGIGCALARRLAAAGDTLILLARRKAPLEALAEEIIAAGGDAVVAVADVTDEAALGQALDQAVARTGPITRLVANAGGGQPTRVDALDLDAVRDTLRLNLDGVIHCIAYVLPAMQRAGRGHLVVMGSLAAVRGLPGAAAYSASKAGIARFTESLAVDLQGNGIDVTLLAPGFVTKPGKRVKWPRMSMATASQRMSRAILRRSSYWRGPPSLIVATAALRLLPSRAYIRLMAGRGRS